MEECYACKSFKVAFVQVDFGGLGLGDGSSDLEHSIMLRQRSLSSRNSLDDLAIAK